MTWILHPPWGQESRQRIVDWLAQDGVLVYPTETFYALGGSACSDRAVERVFELKNRSQTLPLLVLVSSFAMLHCYAQDLNQEQEAFLQRYWPGPLTVLLHPKAGLSPLLNPQGGAVGFRWTSDALAQELIGLAQVPLVGTSANLSGQPACTSLGQVLEQINHPEVLCLQGGDCPGGLPSTLIDMTRATGFTILRQGALDLSQAQGSYQGWAS